MGRIIFTVKANTTPKINAYSYQVSAFSAVKDLSYAAIFHEQGLGKTKIAIDLLLYWIESQAIDTVLIVTKKMLIKNWIDELNLHTFIDPKILEQNKSKNYYIFNSASRVILSHFEVIYSEKERFKLFLKTRDIGIIIDESAKIKNPRSSVTRTFMELSPLFKKRIIMTGTPVANRPFDLWSQIYFLDQGKSLGNDYDSFKKDTDMPGDCIEKQDKYADVLGNIFNKISSFTVRETKDNNIITLPQKIIERVNADWENQQYEIYRNIQKELRVTVMQEGVFTEDKSEATLKRLLRLIQVASNPRLIDESYNREPGKYIVTDSLVEQFIDKKEKCIIWTSFVENADWLQNKLRIHKAVKVHGRLTISERNKAIDRFKNNDDVKVLIATPASAKEGLTLTVANNVIFYDRTFSLDDYLQAQDRIHRISQKRTCYVYNLIIPESIDEWVDSLLSIKHLAAQLAQNDIDIDQYRSLVDYSYTDLIRSVLDIKD